MPCFRACCCRLVLSSRVNLVKRPGQSAVKRRLRSWQPWTYLLLSRRWYRSEALKSTFSSPFHRRHVHVFRLQKSAKRTTTSSCRRPVIHVVSAMKSVSSTGPTQVEPATLKSKSRTPMHRTPGLSCRMPPRPLAEGSGTPTAPRLAGRDVTHWRFPFFLSGAPDVPAALRSTASEV